jgi:hypothetical protein
MKKYKLYVSTYQALPKEVEYTYFSPTSSGYMLAYHYAPIDGMKEVAREDLLKPEEKKWLLGVKLTVNAEAINDSAESINKALSDFLTVFERELKAQADKKKGN